MCLCSVYDASFSLVLFPKLKIGKCMVFPTNAVHFVLFSNGTGITLKKTIQNAFISMYSHTYYNYVLFGIVFVYSIVRFDYTYMNSFAISIKCQLYKRNLASEANRNWILASHSKTKNGKINWTFRPKALVQWCQIRAKLIKDVCAFGCKTTSFVILQCNNHTHNNAHNNQIQYNTQY